MGRIQGYEQSRIVISAAGLIFLKVYLGFCIEVDSAFFVALAVNDTLPLMEIHIGNIQIDQLSDTDSG